MSGAIPFGMHKGKPLSAVPDDYLRWLGHVCDDAEWRVLALEEMARRQRASEAKAEEDIEETS